MKAENFQTRFHNFFLNLIRLFFPEQCVLCGLDLLFRTNRKPPVCDSCQAQLIPIQAVNRCRVCSAVLISELGICTRCRERSYHFRTHYSLFVYSGAVKELIYQYKFQDKQQIRHLWAAYLGAVIEKRFKDKIVVPVPAGHKGKKKRGWDHMEVITRIIGKNQQTIIVRCLTRDKTREQKALDYDMRMINLRDKIHCSRPEHIRGREILLLDDVFTTGATVSECARVLLAAGAAGVDALTLAID